MVLVIHIVWLYPLKENMWVLGIDGSLIRINLDDRRQYRAGWVNLYKGQRESCKMRIHGNHIVLGINNIGLYVFDEWGMELKFISESDLIDFDINENGILLLTKRQIQFHAYDSGRTQYTNVGVTQKMKFIRWMQSGFAVLNDSFIDIYQISEK